MTFLNFTVPDASPLIDYSAGQWVEGSPTNDSFAAEYTNGSFKVTFDAASTATFTFMGTSITIFGAERLNHGNYSVSLDDGPAFVGDGNANNLFQFPLWNAQNLPNTQHTAVMTNIPTIQGKFLDIDFISIGRELGPPGFTGSISTVMLDDESPFMTYSPPGSWMPMFASDAFNGSLHKTTDENASVSLSFQGSSIEIYGLYVNAPFQVHLDNQLPRNLAGPNVDLNSQQEHPQTLLYLADGLNESEIHSLTLINSVANSDRPLFIDYAIVRSSQQFFEDTPSPNPNFTQTATASSATATAKNTTVSAGFAPHQTSTGAIVGGVIGGVAGVIILGFIGFILFRRSRYYHGPSSGSNNENGNRNILPVSNPVSQFSSSTITPFILPTMPPPMSDASNTTSSSSNAAATKQSISQQSYSSPSTLVAPSSERLSVSQFSSLGSPIAETYENRQLPLVIGGSTNQSRGNTLISQTYVLQEQDAGRLVQTSLPPMYNADWQDTTSTVS
ncbi:hypothetical protein Clacol_000043 [Clathrus columnatus]|uniref:Peptidase A1 domain-containing protein n=1 Tax=Clathrus columnatus TaxID=1419009 RepID=A0AAV4ZZW7_9AGAM|nr:hypothetical protein Clacol_000043 [Clathrus columnatus]